MSRRNSSLIGRKCVTLLVAVISIIFPSIFAYSWDLSIEAQFEHRHRYYSRSGERDLFGYASAPVPQDINDRRSYYVINSLYSVTPNSLLKDDNYVGFAGPSCYGTGWTATRPSNTALDSNWRITRGGHSRGKSDFCINQSRLTLRPELTIADAIRISCVYNALGIRNRFTKYNNPREVLSRPMVTNAAVPTFINVPDPEVRQSLGTPPISPWYTHETTNNDEDTTGMGTFETFEIDFSLPWGELNIGTKDIKFGAGATLGYGSSLSAISIRVPYGPIDFTWHVWPGHLQDDTASVTIPLDLFFEQTRPQLSQLMTLVYRNGPLELGALGFWQRLHLGQGALSIVDGSDDASGERFFDADSEITFTEGVSALDQNVFFNVLYAKYCQWPLVFAAEYSWFLGDNYFRGAPPWYQEGHKFFTEMGLYVGPAKITGMFALSSGQVKNNPNSTKIYTRFPIHYNALAPYERLMFTDFLGGNQTVSGFFLPSDGRGMLSDAYAFGGRLDYSLAANLNIWGSYLWAHRLERAGTYIGEINENDSSTQPGTSDDHPRDPDAALLGLPAKYFGNVNGRIGNPYVDDGHIGWEVNLGLEWRLLEDQTLRMRYSRWHPGQWFTWAYQAITLRDGEWVRDGVLTKRDAIQCFEWNVVFDF